MSPLVLIPLSAVAALPMGYLIWIAMLRHAPSAGSRSSGVRYAAPEEIGLAEASVLLTGGLPPRAVAATLVDLHRRGLLGIEEAGGVVSAIVRAPGSGPMSAFEKVLLETAFGGSRERVTSANAARRMRSEAKLLVAAARGSLKQSGAYADETISRPIVGVATPAAALALSLAMVPAVGFAAATVTFLITVFLGELAYFAASRRRPLSDRGKRLYWELVGYREYLRAAEAGRIRWNEASGHPADEHLPYAIIFGISTAWATKLQSVTNAFLESFPS